MDFQKIVGSRIDFWERRRTEQKMTAKDLIEMFHLGLIRDAQKFWKSEFEKVKADCTSACDEVDDDFETWFSKSELKYTIEKLEDCNGFEFGYKVKSKNLKTDCDFWIELKYGVRQANCIMIEFCIAPENTKPYADRMEIGFITDEDEKFLVKFCDHIFADFDEILERALLACSR